MGQDETVTPQVALDVYLTLIERGDYAGAFNTYCVVQGNARPDALTQLRADVDRLAQEVDVLGVARSLALFAPLTHGPLRWTPKESHSGADGTWIDYEVSAQLTFPQRVFFRSAPSGWKIDAAQTLNYNAQGTKVGSIIAQTLASQGCQDHLRALALAFSAYLDAHGQRLPPAETWRREVAAYVQDRTVFDCPGGGDGSLAMNRLLSGTLGREIVDPQRTILLFDSPSGQVVGDGDGALEFRHGQEANVLLADGSVRSVENTRGLKWMPGTKPTGPVREARVSVEMEGPTECVGLREALEPFGARIVWNAAASATVVTALGHTCQLVEGGSTASLDGKTIALPTPAVTRGGKLQVPVSFLSRAFGLRVAFGEKEVVFSSG